MLLQLEGRNKGYKYLKNSISLSLSLVKFHVSGEYTGLVWK